MIHRKKGLCLCRIEALPGKNHHHSIRFFNRIVRLHGLRCAACGSVSHYLTKDHIKKKCDGGSNDIQNLQLLCLECHRKKDNIISGGTRRS